MRPALSVALLAAILASACAQVPPPPPPVVAHQLWGPRAPLPLFTVEPTSHASFSGRPGFTAGTRIRFVSYGLAPDEQLRLQRCGDGCNTAKLVGSWTHADFDKSPSQEITLTQRGDYYVWLRQERADGEIGPVPAVAATFDRDAGVLRFASGATVLVAVDGTGVAEYYPDDPVRVMGDVVFDPASPLRKLQSAAILERARHQVLQDLIVQVDHGDEVEALLQKTYPQPGEDNDDPAVMARHQAAQQAWQTALSHANDRFRISLRAAGLEATQDFTMFNVVVRVPDEAHLRALQDLPWVKVVSENGRVFPS